MGGIKHPWVRGRFLIVRVESEDLSCCFFCLLFFSCYKAKPFVTFHVFGGEKSGNVLVFLSLS